MDKQGWTFIVTIFKEDGKDRHFVTHHLPTLLKFMGCIEYGSARKVTVIKYDGIILEDRT